MNDPGQNPGGWQAPDRSWDPPAPPGSGSPSPTHADIQPEPVGIDAARSVAAPSTGSTHPNWSTVFAVVGCVMVVVLSGVIAYLLNRDGERRATPPSTPPTAAVTPAPITAAPTTTSPTTAPATTGPPPTTMPTTAPATTGPQVPAEELTPTQRAAVQKARSLIASRRTSRAGTIGQLTDNQGFTVEDATVAVDSLGIDWNKTALRAARYHIAVGFFSRRSLLEKLTGPYSDAIGDDAFTTSEAAYALDNLDADWDFEAAQAAKAVLDTLIGSAEPPTCEDVLNELTETDGFTSEQAQRGAQTAGAC